MTASELHRKLLYCGHNDLTDYLRDSPLNRFIYKQLLALKPLYNIETPVLNIFNEVYYQCVHIQKDRKPGMEVNERFMNESGSWLVSLDTALLVFSMVKAFYVRKGELSFEEECFWEQFDPLLKDNKFDFIIERLLSFMHQNEISIPSRFTIMHVPFTELPDDTINGHLKFSQFFKSILIDEEIKNSFTQDGNGWAVITDGFSPKAIEWLIDLYPKTMDRLDLLYHIDSSCPHNIRSRLNFDALRSRIRNEAGGVRAPLTEYDETEDYDRMFAAGYQQTVEEDMNDKDEQFREERKMLENQIKNLKLQLEEQQKNYEAKMKDRELVFMAEMESMRKELLDKCQKAIISYEKLATAHAIEVHHPKSFSLAVSDMVVYVKKFFSESAANQFINMYYHYAIKYNRVGDEVSQLMDGIIPSIQQRNIPYTKIDIPSAGQVNINPQNVHTHLSESDT